MPILLHRSIKELKGAPSRRLTELRTSNVLKRGRLAEVGADSKPKAWWRTPTKTPRSALDELDPNDNLPAGKGRTTPFGDVEWSIEGPEWQQWVAYIHEMVHSLLRPRLRPFRTFFVRLSVSAYWRSAFLNAFEEMLAETVAQLWVHGPRNLLIGIRFPVVNGYVTIGELVREGAAIGSIIVGGVHLEVHFVEWARQVIKFNQIPKSAP
jgi:hypothetical protein